MGAYVMGKPPVPPGHKDPTNQDVLDAIEGLSAQVANSKVVTNRDVLSAVHGVSQQINSMYSPDTW